MSNKLKICFMARTSNFSDVCWWSVFYLAQWLLSVCVYDNDCFESPIRHLGKMSRSNILKIFLMVCSVNSSYIFMESVHTCLNGGL